MVFITDRGVNTEAADQILAEIEKTLHEMRNLTLYTIQNELTVEQRTKVQERIDELKREIDGIAEMLIPPDVPMQ